MPHRVLPGVLLIEDNVALVRAWRRVLSRHATIVTAETVADAMVVFAHHPDVQLIVMDGCLGGNVLNTLDLIREFRKTFKGPMVAASGVSGFCDQMCIAGCDYRVIEKSGLPDLVTRLLMEMRSS